MVYLLWKFDDIRVIWEGELENSTTPQPSTYSGEEHEAILQETMVGRESAPTGAADLPAHDVQPAIQA